MTKLNNFIKEQKKKKKFPQFRVGDEVKVYQYIDEKMKESEKKEVKEQSRKTQVFKGIIISHKHGGGIGATIIVRKISGGIGVERIYPVYSPNIAKIEIVKRAKVRRAKIYYLRNKVGRARMKVKDTSDKNSTILKKKLTV